MRTSRIIIGIGASIAAIASLSAVDPRVASAEPNGSSIPGCMSVGTDSRYIPYGYNHVVILKNGCSKAATCSVATDVNPQASTVEVTAGATIEVLTFMASSSQTFNAHVSCKLR